MQPFVAVLHALLNSAGTYLLGTRMTPQEGKVAAAYRKFCRLWAQEPDQPNLACSSAATSSSRLQFGRSLQLELPRAVGCEAQFGQNRRHCASG